MTDAFVRAVRNDAALAPRVRRQGLPHGAGARAVGPHDARHLRLCRARRGVHRPHQRREQSRLLRGDQRHQSVRRAAAAAAWRLPAGLDQSGAPGRQAVHARRRGSTRRGCEALTATAVRFLDNAIDISNYPLPAQTTGGQGQAPHRSRRHRPCRRADPGRRALRHARGRGAGRALDGHDRAGRLPRQRRAGAREGRVPALRSRSGFWRRAQRASACPRMCARRSPQHGIRNGLLTSIAPDRHHLAAGRQRLERHRAGVRLPLRAPRARARRLHAHRDGGGLRPRALPRDVRRRRAAAPRPS